MHSRIRTEYETQTLAFVYYPEQQIYICIYIYINNILYIVSDPTCFDAPTSSAGGFILLFG